MNLFGFLWRRQPTCAELRAELFRALSQGDAHAAETLWIQHGAGIKRRFTEWLIIPAEIRRRPEDQANYWANLRAAAAFLAAKGEPQFTALVEAAVAATQPSSQAASARNDTALPQSTSASPGGRDPEQVWELAVFRAQQLIDDQQYQQAYDLLTSLGADVLAAQGFAADACRRKTAGLLGVACFRLGRKADAIRYTQEAIEECRRQLYQPGVELYVAQLNKIHNDYHGRA